MSFVTAAAALFAPGSAGDLEAGQAQANGAMYKSQVAKNNSDYASEVGQSLAVTQSMKNANELGHITTSQAANGVDINNGSAVNVRQGARMAGTMDTQNVENNALLTAYGYQQDAAIDKAEAQQAKTGSYFKVAAGLIGAAKSIPGK